MKPRVLVVGDAVATTGFARVLHAILEPLRDRYDIHHVGVNYHGDPHDAGWRIYPASLGGDVYGIGRLGELLHAVRPDLVFVLYDLWIVAKYAKVLAEHPHRCPSIAYFPVDGAPVEPSLVSPLAALTRLVSYNEFGRRAMEGAMRAAGQDAREVLTIPHGVDARTFHPLDPLDERNSRRLARREVFPARPDLEDAFIVLNANRNQPRKRIDQTMKGFALFARDKPANVKLMLHMGVEDMGWNVMALAARLGIEERLIVTSPSRAMPSVSVEQLNLIYNACDVGINTATAEGWGLPSFEHAATKAAQIVPRHTACAELWEGCAELVEPRFTLSEPATLTDAHYVIAEDVAAALERLYADPERRARIRDAGYVNATRPEYRWERIAEQWGELWSATIEAPQARAAFANLSPNTSGQPFA